MVESLIATMDDIVKPDHKFMVPTKKVSSVADMEAWTKSEAYEEYLGFIYALNQAVKGLSNTADCSMSEGVVEMVGLLNTLDEMIDQTPPIDQPQRFGNQAFTQWLKKLNDSADRLLKNVLPENLHAAIPEIRVYFMGGFGNGTRIDYGTGHEMSFLMLICCLFKIGALRPNDKVAAVTKIFARYMTLARKLQTTYRMEPAGSHGVWSLDDYQFVPFVWGSSQLMGQGTIEPKMFLDKEVQETYSEEYLFIGCIEFINKVKTGQFAEHSNQLWNISAIPMWSNINQGLIKMYKAEVLGKFPVVQHVLFGSLLSFERAKWRPPRRTFQHSLEHMVSGAPMRPPPPLLTTSLVQELKTRSAVTTLVTIPADVKVQDLKNKSVANEVSEGKSTTANEVSENKATSAQTSTAVISGQKSSQDSTGQGEIQS